MRGVWSSQRSQSRRGFSIIEATLAVVLVGTALVASLNVAAAASRTSATSSDRRQALQLAHMLMDEIMAQPASGTTTSNGSTGNRIDTFTHVTDYDGFRESPPTTANGEICGPDGWEWRASVSERPAESFDSRTVDFQMYQIAVRVVMPDGTEVVLASLRSRTNMLDRAPTSTVESVTQVPISMRLGDGTKHFAQPEVRANRPPEGATVRKK
ncbi:MAG: hypothetical protein ACFCBV_10135 [Phycisphaerales bacterium]